MLCGENEPLLLPMNSIYIKYGDWTMKKNLIVLFVCMIFFTGCSSLCITSNAMSSDGSMVQAYTASLEKSNLRTYIDVYESQLLYMEMGRTAVEFFIYNFQTGENQSVGHVSDFALKGRSNVMIDDILYFYISTYSDNDMKNVLYAVDFSEMKMTPISENLYLQKLIPVVEMNNQIIALQGNALSDGSMDTFLETITKDGDFKQISIDSSKVNPKYIKYYCMSDEYKGWVQGHLTGSTRGNINAQTYANMEISIPPREQQNRIVSILEELERKRKNNIAINRNLALVA